MKAAGKIEKEIIGDPVWVAETLHKKYLEPLGHAIQAGISSVKEESEKAMEHMVEHIHSKDNQLGMLLSVLSRAKEL